MTRNKRKEEFIASLEAAKTGMVQEWFQSARDEIKGKAAHLEQAFMCGAIPEVFNMDAYGPDVCLKRTTQQARQRGREWRSRNTPAIVGCWFRGFRFEKPDGTYTVYRLPLDPVVIDGFIRRVKRSKSFT